MKIRASIIFYLLLFCADAFGYSFSYDVPCPSSGATGRIALTLRTSGTPLASSQQDQGIIATSLESRQILQFTHNHTFYINALCESSLTSHISWSGTYSNAITSSVAWSASAPSAAVNTGQVETVSLMIGALTAIAFSMAAARGLS